MVAESSQISACRLADGTPVRRKYQSSAGAVRTAIGGHTVSNWTGFGEAKTVSANIGLAYSIVNPNRFLEKHVIHFVRDGLYVQAPGWS